MGMDQIITEIEDYIAECHRIPLTEKVILGDDDLMRLVEDLRKALPEELEKAVDIVNQRDAMIAAAKAEAERIIANAENDAKVTKEKTDNYVQESIDESQVVQQAINHGQQLVDQATAEAKEIREAAELYAQQLRGQADNYAIQMFSHVINNMTNTMEMVNQNCGGAIQALEQARQQIAGTAPEEEA